MSVSFPLGGMMIWFDVEKIKQNKIKGNIRKEGGVRFFVCLFALPLEGSVGFFFLKEETWKLKKTKPQN